PRAANTLHPNAHGVPRAPLGSRNTHSRCRRRDRWEHTRGSARGDEEKGRTVTFHTAAVEIARGLLDLCLSPELRLHGQERQAGGGRAAVAAPFAHPLVDPDALRRRGQLAALAQTPLLGGALIVVDDDRDARHTLELGFDTFEVVSMANCHILRQE